MNDDDDFDQLTDEERSIVWDTMMDEVSDMSTKDLARTLINLMSLEEMRQIVADAKEDDQ